MRRQLLALTLLTAAVGVAAQQASTAGNTFAVDSNAASYRSVTIENTSTRSTSLRAVSYKASLLDPTKTASVSATFSGGLSGRTIRARYGTDSPVLCTFTVHAIVGGVLGAEETRATCTGLREDADRPRALTFLIS